MDVRQCPPPYKSSAIRQRLISLTTVHALLRIERHQAASWAVPLEEKAPCLCLGQAVVGVKMVISTDDPLLGYLQS